MYEDKDIKNMEDMLRDCSRMQTFLENTSAGTNADLLEQRLLDINAWLAYAGNLWAKSRQIQDRYTASFYNDHLDLIMRMPATVATKYVSSSVHEINYIANWLERINRELVHQADNIRTVVSLEKEHLRLTKKGY